MCLEASLVEVPSSEHGGESGCLARTSQVAGIDRSASMLSSGIVGRGSRAQKAADGLQCSGCSVGVLCGGRDGRAVTYGWSTGASADEVVAVKGRKVGPEESRRYIVDAYLK
jgi:hypothetical protein